MPTTLQGVGPERVLAWLPEHEVDDEVRAQALRTAGVACVHGHVALMPDAHLGKGATIGSVIPTAEAIIPSAVGVDIGCGVVAAPVRDLTLERLPDDLDPLVERWARAIPAGLGQWTADVDRAWAAFEREHGHPTLWERDPKVATRAPRQLGTLGSGNHFLELCADDEGQIWIMLHSGSRGPGNRLAMHHIERAKGTMRRWSSELTDPDLAYLVQGEPEFDAYIHDLQWAQAYARVNRDRMVHLALEQLGQLADRSLEFDVDRFVDNHHNYAAREEHDGRTLWITRKGAISARRGQLGVIPGSMGTGSYVVRGLGNPAAYHSASHGAGRRMSRSKARRTFTAGDMERAMQGRVWQRAAARQLIDEIPGAYKDLDQVMAYQHDLVEVVAHLRTLVNYKGT
jgi:tRNA-splicing ligase RtcB (3'-phosphate/5'-hydroxy nucleic acid ligase)